MLLARVYGVAWLLSILLLLITFSAGLLSSIALVVFGKLFIGLIFIGIIGVLPTAVRTFPAEK